MTFFRVNAHTDVPTFPFDLTSVESLFSMTSLPLTQLPHALLPDGRSQLLPGVFLEKLLGSVLGLSHVVRGDVARRPPGRD